MSNRSIRDGPNLQGLDIGRHRLPCPECYKGPRDTALSVEVRADGSAVWLCWRCRASGGTRGSRVLTVQHTRVDPRAADRQRSNNLAACRAIWKQTQPLRGTAGENYLLLRHCAIPPADGDLRFHAALFCPEVAAELPALVARVTTVIGNKAIGVHRIWFRSGEAKAVKKMRLGGSAEPVCTRLWPDSEIALGLGIAEGVETALAGAHWYKPVWSTIDAGQLAKFRSSQASKRSPYGVTTTRRESTRRERWGIATGTVGDTSSSCGRSASARTSMT